MSEPTSVEEQQEAPLMREPASGPLLPRWFLVAFYAIFIPFSIYSVFHITHSLIVQHRLRGAVGVVRGTLDAPAADLQSAEGEAAMRVFRDEPLQSFLYAIQELLQDEDKDPRMARALALRRAIGWGEVSARRDVIRQILDVMGEEGSLPADFALDQDAQRVLEAMVEERRADPEMTYVEDLITDVLAWVAEGHPGQPRGPEKRRLAALQGGLAKKVFQGAEAEALEQLRSEWAGEADPLKREAARAFARMLAVERVALSPEVAQMCADQADHHEGLFREGMVRIAEVSRKLAEQLVEEAVFVDHPHIYQYLSLLEHRFPEVRQEVAAGVYLLRHSRFTIRFLSYFATKTTINPFMAVETVRLTREEHQRLMRRANHRRMREAVALLGRIGVDYIHHPDAYELRVPEPREFVRRRIVSALSEVADEPVISELVEEALTEMRRADAARSGGPVFFGESA
jgi:hypothetical protein